MQTKKSRSELEDDVDAGGGGEDCVVGDSIGVDIGKDGGLDDDKVDGIAVDAGGGGDCKR